MPTKGVMSFRSVGWRIVIPAVTARIQKMLERKVRRNKPIAKEYLQAIKEVQKQAETKNLSNPNDKDAVRDLNNIKGGIF